jgi:hypothetical protein
VPPEEVKDVLHAPDPDADTRGRYELSRVRRKGRNELSS